MSKTKYLTDDWITFDGRQVNDKTIDHQHLSNVYWYLKVFWGMQDFQLWQILEEIQIRYGGTVLPYRPHPRFIQEHVCLHKKGMIDKDGNIIFKGEIIGSIISKSKKKLQLEN